MPAKLYLVRHGETESNVKKVYQGAGNSLLTENGILMAKELAAFLKDLDFNGIYCSDLTRGVETANRIAKFHQVSPTIIPDLKERNYGVWEGMQFGDIAIKYADLYKVWHQDPAKAKIPEAETLEQLQTRVLAALRQIIDQHPSEENICIVGHGGTNRAILFHYLGLDLNQFWKIRQSNCCVNVVEFGKRICVAAVNCTGFVKNATVNKLSVY